ncbi:ATP-binding protein [Paludisphaera rhizosphaerae]|uniref:ATP-binding protein n=1 Tax=Paludisphaera rhizosphaerae TaxID=2711216 RepID=UPI0013E9FA3F|nr:ATP-binding protein [Paludisphaera rhizosphaerae]
MKNEDFEKLGVFYLGKEYDLGERATTPNLLLYDSKQLTTHAVCVGMTGSGKTGLCIAMLEEAAIDGIPVIAVDPKGDIGNLLLDFPQLRGQDFLPWVDPDEASRQGMTAEAFADKTAETWKDGLAKWGQDGARIQRLMDSADMAIYTPGSSAGLPLTVLRSFSAPSAALREQGEAYRERISSAVSGLLALLGIDSDPMTGREHILLSSLLDRSWRDGRDLDLTDLIHAIQSPSFDKVGVIDLETFYPAKERFALALRLNNLLASPGFAAWMEGDALDVGGLLYTPEGKPRISVLSIAHLSDAERMFFVTILLNEVLSWVRAQPGTSSLRAILYMDEIYGYFPPSANPPTKKPMLTLLKQARAFGVGVVLATQNPVDLDYKGLSNCGTWFLGRLQTKRDKDRVLEGLEGASNAAGASFDRAEMDKTLSSLGKRVFLLNNVHEDHPIVFESRWALSYLRGPLNRDQIQTLMAPKKKAKSAPAKDPAGETIPARPAAVAPADETGDDDPPAASKPKPAPAEPEPRAVTAAKTAVGRRPVMPPDVPEFFVVDNVPSGSPPTYRPSLLGVARLHYIDKKSSVDYWETLAVQRPVGDEMPADVWEGGKHLTSRIPVLDKTPETGATFADLPSAMARAKNYAEWTKDLKAYLYRDRRLTIWTCPELKAYGRPEETARDFRARLAQAAREKRDAEVEKLRAAFGPRRADLEKKLKAAHEALEKEQAKASKSGWDAAVSFGTSVLDAFTGRKTWTKTNVTKVGSAAKAASKAMRERGQVGSAQDRVDDLNSQYVELETEFQTELEHIKTTRSPELLKLVPLELTPRKSDVTIDQVVLAWTAGPLPEDGEA